MWGITSRSQRFCSLVSRPWHLWMFGASSTAESDARPLLPCGLPAQHRLKHSTPSPTVPVFASHSGCPPSVRPEGWWLQHWRKMSPNCPGQGFQNVLWQSHASPQRTVCKREGSGHVSRSYSPRPLPPEALLGSWPGGDPAVKAPGCARALRSGAPASLTSASSRSAFTTSAKLQRSAPRGVRPPRLPLR